MARGLQQSRYMAGLFDAIQPLHRSLDFHTERHNVLASNIANVDTPGFRALELIRGEAGGDDLGFGGPPLRLATSHERHFPRPGAASEPDLGEVREDPTAQIGADGNSVSLDREMSKLAANDLRYETATALVRSHLGGLRYAAGDFQG
jgi:flagellar basal-body rod protein FlgB